MEEVLNTTTEIQGENDNPKTTFETQVNDYLKNRFPGKSIEELYRTNIGDIYTGSAVQKRRLVSYLIIRQEGLTIDKVLKQSGKATDYNSKSAIFKDYVSRSLIDIKKAGSLNYRGTMEQNLEILHLLVQELYFGSLDISVPSSQLRELKKDVAVIREQPVVPARPKQQPVKAQKQDNSILSGNRDFTAITESTRTDYLTSLTTAVFDQKGQTDTQTVSHQEGFIPANLPAVDKDEGTNIESNIVRGKVIKGIDPKMMPSKNYEKDWMFGRCSMIARLYLQSLGIKKEDIIVGNSIDIIRELKKKKTGTEYGADILAEELLKRMQEGKGNIYDSYFLTPLGHRVILFVGQDNELYVIDPYYAGRKPVKIMDYFLSKSPKGVRKVMIPNGDGYTVTEEQLVQLRDKNKKKKGSV